MLFRSELAGRNFVMQDRQRILMDEIAPGGIDELGVLLAGHPRNAYWFGSQLSVDEARHYLRQGHFAQGSMRPKIEAAIDYAQAYPKRGRPYPARSLKRTLAHLADLGVFDKGATGAEVPPRKIP